MKVNINLEIDDARRNVLARLIEGKDIKRLATRDEVREFVDGCIESLATAQVSPPVPEAPTGQAATSAAVASVPPLLAARIEELRAEGKGEAYISGFVRGWTKGGKA